MMTVMWRTNNSGTQTLKMYQLTPASLPYSHQACVVLPAALWLLTRRNPWDTLCAFGPALALAFGTSSSSAALGVTMQCAKDVGCEDATVKFFLPLGTTCNMNGTALYEATTVLFIAQVRLEGCVRVFKWGRSRK